VNGRQEQEIGPQYSQDNAFKAAARLHQSQYRARVLNVDFNQYGNRLTDGDARRLLNYYDGLNVRESLRSRYPVYSKERDGDMLRSEHIPFNMFAPFRSDFELARQCFRRAFALDIQKVLRIEFEYPPEPKEKYLNDNTAFDTYVEYWNERHEKAGIGIEVKYSETAYTMGKTEGRRVQDPESRYWRVTKAAGIFRDDREKEVLLPTDSMRQIWRNHLLGLAMLQTEDIKEFTSIIVHPQGNPHFLKVLPEYQAILLPSSRHSVQGVTYETFIDAIDGKGEILQWQAFLKARYLVRE